jgi:pimeloyl-ACP methyl ester carboxylesterase
VVLAGQYLERPALIPCGPLTLEGLFHRGRRSPALLLCPPVGENGMDAPALAELAWASSRAGHASLRFQHRGFGASGGERDPALAGEDAEAALAHLAATVPGPLAVAGLGTGCATALALLRAHPEVGRGLLLAPAEVPDAAGVQAELLALLPEGGSPVSLTDAGRALGPGGRAQVIAGLDAAFRSGLTSLGRAAVAFLGGR